MKTLDAGAKACPFMTRPIHEAPIGPNMSGITMTWYMNCMTAGCMAWVIIEPASDGLEQGYCTLVEKELQ